MKKITAILITLGILSTTVFGDDIADAFAAYEKKEYKKAFKLFNQACDGGDSRGCGMVGVLYESGFIDKKNIQEALVYYSKSCDMGNELSCKYYEEKQAMLPVCTEYELSFANDKRYFFTAIGSNFSSILADTKSITIDKKNKIIKVWTTWIATEKERQERIESMGQYNNYENYGYSKRLDVINYRNMTTKNNAFINHNCNGNTINSYNSQGEWTSIVPDSVMEGITESIMKKYNLK